MSTSPAIGLTAAGVVAAFLSLFFGILPLILAFFLLGMAIIIVAGEVEALRNPPAKEPPHPMRFACPGCGGDVYVGQAVCHACGRSLLGDQTRNG